MSKTVKHSAENDKPASEVDKEPAPETEAPLPVEFVEPAKRRASVPLAYPVTHGGRRYDAIGLRRLTAQQVSDFIESLAEDADESAGTLRNFPVFVDGDGELIPEAVMQGLDDDDYETLSEKALDFLPRRLRKLISEPDATVRSSGDTTEASS